MKALTLMQPFASLLIWREKIYETRSRPFYYIGPVAIHASARITPEYRALCAEDPFRKVLDKHNVSSWEELPTGVVLGVICFAGCVPVEKLSVGGQEEAFGNYSPGRFAIRTEGGAYFQEPIPAQGSLGLWDWWPPQAVLTTFLP